MSTKRDFHLILGNGFNLALSDIFGEKYQVKLGYDQIIKGIVTLLDKEERKSKSEKKLEIQKLKQFIESNSDIKDVEWLLWILENSTDCISRENHIYYEIDDNVTKIITNNISLLKKCFINVITSKKYHPDHNLLFNNQQTSSNIQQCAHNLNLFKRIFTINYDLILYWLINNQGLLYKKETKKGFKDGFINKLKYKPNKDPNLLNHLAACFAENNHANLFYLHGAIHLLREISENTPESAFKIVRGYYKVDFIENYNEFAEKKPLTDKIILITKDKNKKWHIKYREKKNTLSVYLSDLFGEEFEESLYRNRIYNIKKRVQLQFEEIIKKNAPYASNLSDIREFLLEVYKNYDNLIVLEGGAKKKISKLFSNLYLEKCYGKLLSSNGYFVIYGCNLSGAGANITADEHIWTRVINSSKIIFICCHLEEGKTLEEKAVELQNSLKELKGIKGKRTIKCFDSKSMNIWKDNFSNLLNGNVFTVDKILK